MLLVLLGSVALSRFVLGSNQSGSRAASWTSAVSQDGTGMGAAQRSGAGGKSTINANSTVPV